MLNNAKKTFPKIGEKPVLADTSSKMLDNKKRKMKTTKNLFDNEIDLADKILIVMSIFNFAHYKPEKFIVMFEIKKHASCCKLPQSSASKIRVIKQNAC